MNFIVTEFSVHLILLIVRCYDVLVLLSFCCHDQLWSNSVERRDYVDVQSNSKVHSLLKG